MRFRFLVGPAALALLTHAAHAQQPALPGAPQPAAPAPPTAPRTTALPSAEVIGHPGEVVGQTYSIETVGGTTFTGTLTEATTETLTFQTQELGLVTIQRLNVRQLLGQTPEQARRGYNYVGNGTRMFFAPTARNLHKGEGSVQVIDIVLTSFNYGITDNISVGAVIPFVPFSGIPFVALNTKVSAPVSGKFNLGGGLLYGFETTGTYRTSGGVAYGVATYGTADTNVSFGLGYGIGSDGIGGSPVGVVGFNARVSRQFSLVNETYLANFDSRGGFGGIAGVRYASPRFSGSLGMLYYSTRYDSGIYPAYLDVAYRFGKVKLK